MSDETKPFFIIVAVILIVTVMTIIIYQNGGTYALRYQILEPERRIERLEQSR